jgi:hypothetical protein
MTEDAKKVWQVMENDFGWSNEPKDFHLEYFEDIINATKQALTIPVVVKSLPQDNYCNVCNLPTDGKKCYSKRCPI